MKGMSTPQSEDSLRGRGEVLSGFHLLKQAALPKDGIKQKVRTDAQDAEDVKDHDALLCAVCRAPITKRSERISINEKHQHVFANPHGYIFYIGCFAHASGCLVAGEETDYFSWFPGYTWQIALCGQCLTLLGWAFRSQDSSFFGLILDKLLEL